MRRILIIGSSGTGKSSCARKLGEILNLPVFHLDCVFWKPNWVESSQEEFDDALELLLEQNQWIIDGNYSRTLEHRLEFADGVVYLDYPTRIALYRALKRQVLHRNKPRPDITPGCKERVNWAFIKWIWTFRKKHRSKILKMLEHAPHVSIFHFQSPKKLKKWFANLHPINELE